MEHKSSSALATGLLLLDDERSARVLEATKHVPTPFFGLDLDAVRARCTRLRHSWAQRFPNLQLAYSYKTNPLPAVTRTLLELGACAEVVSGVELEWALGDGAPPERIYFDGPAKSEAELRRALELGVQVQVDSVDEAASIARLLGERPSSSKLRLRLAVPRNPERWSRFGLFAAEIQQALTLLAAAGGDVSGLHLHVGSNVGGELHAFAIEACGAIIRWFREQIGAEFSLDVGGGYAAATAQRTAPEPDQYVHSVASALERCGLVPELTPLVIEPGRCLVEDAGVLVTRVVASKSRDTGQVVVCDAGTHVLRSAASWRHEFYTLNPEARAGEHRFDLYGANCFEGDLLGAGLSSSRAPRAGDLIVIGGAGGYDIASSAGWIRPRPPVVAWEGGRCFMARRAQSPEELRGAPVNAIRAPSPQLETNPSQAQRQTGESQ